MKSYAVTTNNNRFFIFTGLITAFLLNTLNNFKIFIFIGNKQSIICLKGAVRVNLRPL